MSKNSYHFFCNHDCDYYPCHENINPDELNCLFCFCPLYFNNSCGGNFEILSNGVKDCSKCIFPHLPNNYPAMIEKVQKINDTIATVRRAENGRRILFD